ncbi:hypothetical protein FK004_10130 [Flavobacterium kingsejongi]|uniref:Uncharacterized protein n=1 Tax=Flavobacterium kingsejongi TaxID=1678728 RepID=A0A2S1LPH2_9FLAO|nr:hypothetical protein FK004_10130 [Flavobacterium kingsejongi]
MLYFIGYTCSLYNQYERTIPNTAIYSSLSFNCSITILYEVSYALWKSKKAVLLDQEQNLGRNVKIKSEICNLRI